MPFMGVPTNDELEARGPDNPWQAVRNWLSRHHAPRDSAERERWLDWAATNLINDPEVRGFIRRAKN